MSDQPPVTKLLAAAGWFGLMLFLGWQEFVIETELRWITPWWFRVPATGMMGLVLLVFAIECLVSEMTTRRWATSVLVFAVFGILFIAVGFIDPEKFEMSRWILFPMGLFYLAAAGVSGIAAKDSL